MIKKNTKPRDYRFMLKVDQSLLTSHIATQRLRATWGQPYYHGINPVLWHGFTLDVQQTAAGPGGTPAASWQIEFECPWLGTNFTDSGTGLHEWYFWIYLDEATLSGPCGEATLSFSELRLTRSDSIGGPETLLLTIGAQTSTNVSFTQTENVVLVTPTVSGIIESPGAPSCPSTIGGLPSGTVDSWSGLGYGWTFAVPGSGNWKSATVHFDNDDERYQSCDCSAVVGDVDYPDPPFNSAGEISMTASMSVSKSSPKIGDQTWTCSTPAASYVVSYYRPTAEFRINGIEAIIHQSNGPMRQREIHTVELCGDGITSATATHDATVDDIHVVCLKNTFNYYGKFSTVCAFGPPHGSIPACSSEDGYVADGPAPDEIPDCENSVTITQTWAEPECLEGDVAIMQHHNVRLGALETGEAGDLDSGFWFAGEAVPEFEPIGLTADCVSVAWQRGSQARFLILAGSSDGVKLYRVDNEASFVLMTTISTDVPDDVAIVVDRDGRVFSYWTNSGTVKGKGLDSAGTTIASTFNALTGHSISKIDAANGRGDVGQATVELLTGGTEGVILYRSVDGQVFV